MIDHQKLKLVYELVQKRVQMNDESINITILCNSCEPPGYALTIYDDDPDSDCKYLLHDNIDDLINELQELIQPEEKLKAKYKEGQKIWSILFGEISEIIIEKIYWDEDLNDYRIWATKINCFGKVSTGQSLVYPSKSALIQAQIAYWTSLSSKNPMSGAFLDEVYNFEKKGDVEC